jgi:putative hydrolase of the HAD superfamily
MLGVEPNAAIMIGDDLERDVAGPQRVGMMGVWIDRAGAGVPAGNPIQPDRIIGSLLELL